MIIGVLGTGNMGKALIGGLKKVYGEQVTVLAWDLFKAALDNIGDATVMPIDQWFTQKETPDVVIIAVKPADVGLALAPCKAIEQKATKKPLWISIAAGIPLSFLANQLNVQARAVRVMPNTPALIGEGISAYAPNEFCTNGDAATVEKIFKACGKVVNVQEKLMDAVTGLSGSGPAYVYLFIESLIDAGVTAGLPYSVARECALQTVIGAAKMVEQTNENPAVLKSRVMSPGGTTAAGLKALEQHGFRYAVIDAVNAATERSAQLGK